MYLLINSADTSSIFSAAFSIRSGRASGSGQLPSPHGNPANPLVCSAPTPKKKEGNTRDASASPRLASSPQPAPLISAVSPVRVTNPSSHPPSISRSAARPLRRIYLWVPMFPIPSPLGSLLPPRRRLFMEKDAKNPHGPTDACFEFSQLFFFL